MTREAQTAWEAEAFGSRILRLVGDTVRNRKNSWFLLIYSLFIIIVVLKDWNKTE
ncbi:hypothetical protein G159_18120 [Planococcus glaciei CHR43]|nr:hypothetical protein G159_18120 [Planococcus glaciei CHR43]